MNDKLEFLMEFGNSLNLIDDNISKDLHLENLFSYIMSDKVLKTFNYSDLMEISVFFKKYGMVEKSIEIIKSTVFADKYLQNRFNNYYRSYCNV